MSDLVLVDANGAAVILTEQIQGPPGASFAAISGTGFVHVTGAALDPAARAVNVASIDITGILPISNGGTGLSAIGGNGTVLTSNGTAAAWAAITPTLITPGTAGQVLISSVTPTAVWTSLAGDVSASVVTPGSLTVTGIRGVSVPTPSGTNTSPIYTAGSITWGVPTPTLTQDVSISGTAVTVLQAQDGACTVSPSGGLYGGLGPNGGGGARLSPFFLGAYQGASGTTALGLGASTVVLSGDHLVGTSKFTILGDGDASVGGPNGTYIGTGGVGGTGGIYFCNQYASNASSSSTIWGSVQGQTGGFASWQLGAGAQHFGGGVNVIGISAVATVPVSNPGTASVVAWAGASTANAGHSSLFFRDDNGGVHDLSLIPSAAGTAGQLWIGQSASTLPLWTTVTGDWSITAGGAATITQLRAGAVLVAVTTGALTWAATATPSLSQATLATTPVAFTIQAGNVTTGTGSALVLTSGTGSVAAGAVSIQIGGTTMIGIAAAGAVTLSNLGTGIVHSSSVGLLSSSAVNLASANVTGILPFANLQAPTGTGFTYQAAGTTNASSVTLSQDVSQGALSGSNVPLTVTQIQAGAIVATVTTGALQWGAGATPLLSQAAQASTPVSFVIQAANVTATGNGSNLVLQSGTGVSNGNILLQPGQVTTAGILVGPAGLQIVTPTVGGADFGGGVGVLSLGQVGTTPTAQASSSVLLWGSSTQQLITSAVSLLFSNLQTNASVITHQALASTSAGAGTAGLQFSLLGQAGQATTFASAAGGGGGLLFAGGGAGGASATGAGGAGANASWNAGAGGNATAGTGNGGGGGMAIVNGGAGGTSAGGTAGAAGGVSLRTGGTEVCNWGLNGFGLVPTSQSIAGSGTTTLALAVYKFGLINLTGTLTGPAIVVFPNAIGTWLVVISVLVGLSGTNTLVFQSGSATTSALTSLTTGSTILIITTTGANGISINL